MVTHELESILKVGKTCIMLDKESKGIIARGSPAELKASSPEPKVRQFFQRQARVA
jgi:phospholipid/cholesterol/gamma-HCH transport system ATP-binding protein